MSSLSNVTPYITNEGYLDCGVNSNIHHVLPDSSNWIINVEAEITGDVGIIYNNNVDGGLSFRNANNGFKIYESNDTYNTVTASGDFTDNNVLVNTLQIEKNGNNIIMRYIDTEGEPVTYTANYNNISVKGTLFIRVANGHCILHSLTFLEQTGGGGF